MLNGIENSDSDQLKSGALFSWSARLILCLKRRGSEMDDDNYNTIDPRDLFGDDDDDQLMYGDDQMQSDEPVGVISELNALDQRRPKRPINVDDCDALDWHMRVPCSFEELYECHRKEQENEEILNRITSRILQARKRRRMNANLEANQEDAESEKENHQNRVDVMLYPPTDGTPWIGVSAPDYGQRYYLRLRNVSSSSLLRHRTSDRHSSTASTSKHSNPTQLNSRPIDAILESARLELQSRLEAKQACDRMEFEPYPMETILSSPNCADSELWVDKYAPKTYVDLISDERINRLLLKWLKLWDECVFKRRLNELMLSSSEERDDIVSMDNGKPRRPSHKVVLISGPAGLGKTTLAGVAARQCGYRVVEMNASDDRNVGDFERKIEGALRSVRTLDADSRPNCLVVDEIDGAPVDSIKYLCKTLSATGRKAIRRPVICICNNLYVPALRELRSIALVLQMPHAEQRRLEERLEQIANSEHVRIESSALAELVGICALDLRSSINALQFLSIQSDAHSIDFSAVQKYGERESHVGEKSLFDGWASVFEMGRHMDGHGKVLELSARLQRVQTITQRFQSESEKFHLGLFSNYLSALSGMHRVPLLKDVTELFSEYDQLNSLMMHSQNYALMKYIFVVSAQLHILLASLQRVQLTFPTDDQNCYQQRRQSFETVLSVRSNSTQRGIPERVLTLDLLPMLVLIVQPPLKTANAQLYSARERSLIQTIVSVMRSYSLSYTANFQDGVTSFIFCPPVDVLVLFPLESSEQRRSGFLSNTVRQMIAHRIQLARIRSEELPLDKENNDQRQYSRRINEQQLSSKNQSPNQASCNAKSAGDGNDNLDRNRIIYRYNQGFSNAIRRNIRMRNLIF